MSDPQLLDDQAIPSKERRRKLLPVWIKIFLWMFFIFAAIVPVALVLGVLGINIDLSLYGFEAVTPYSLEGSLIMLLFIHKGSVSFGLWTEKDWAIKLAIADAILGIVICTIMTIASFVTTIEDGFTFRLELIALIPYLIKMMKIKDEWANR